MFKSLKESEQNALVFNCDLFTVAALGLIEAARVISPKISIIIISSEPSKELKARIRKYRDIAVIKRPYNQKVLAELCKKILDGQEVYIRSHQRFNTIQGSDVENTTKGTVFKANMTNMSRGGCLLEVAGKMDVSEGDMLKMTMQLTQVGKSHQVYGEVVRVSNPNGNPEIFALGIRYVSPEDFYNAVVEKFSKK